MRVSFLGAILKVKFKDKNCLMFEVITLMWSVNILNVPRVIMLCIPHKNGIVHN